MRFPRKIKIRGQTRAVIYGKSEAYPFYRACYSAGGRRFMKSFGTYSEALTWAEERAGEVAKGNQVATLTPKQAADTLAALERLQAHFQDTGRRFSVLAAVSNFTEADAKLGGRSVAEAVDGFLSTVVTVRRVGIAEAVEEFIAGEEPRTKAEAGKRPDISPKYHFNRSIMLRKFAGALPGNVLSELTKAHLDVFFASLDKIPSKSRNKKPAASAKVRNHYRNTLRQFFGWAMRKDYLAANHRLLEADRMRVENGNTAEIEFYTANEFLALLQNAEGPMRALIAIGGLAGLRTAELLRLTWEDTQRVEGHIEITSGKAKTRQRRLVEIVPALAQWLTQFNEQTGLIWPGHEITFQQHFRELCGKAKVPRKNNGLRHAFATYHLALHGNENATALQAGHAPQMLFAHYRGLAKKSEAEAWFAVAPAVPENVINLAQTAS